MFAFADISLKPLKFEAELTVTRPEPDDPIAALSFDATDPPFAAHISAKSLSNIDAYRRALERYYGKDLDWDRLLPKACRMAEEAYKAAPTDLDPTDVTLQHGSPHLIDQILPEHELSVMFGLGEAAKSLSALGMCMALGSRNADFAGYAVGRATTLWVDYENPTPNKLALRMNRIISDDDGFTPEGRAYVPGAIRWMAGKGIAIPELTPTLKRSIARLNARLVVVDSAGPACGGNALDQEVATRTTNALLSLGVTVILIAHTTKGEDDRMPFGSAFWHYAVHGKSWFMKRTSEAESDEIMVGWYNRKVSDGPRPRDFAVRVTFDGAEGPIRFEKASLSDDPELRARQKLPDQIVAALRVPMLTSDLAEALDANQESVRRACARLRDKFVLFETREGKESKWGKLLK